MESLFTETADALPHLLLVLFAVAGLAGSLLPGFPGPALILIGALAHGFWTGWDPLSPVVQGILGVLTLASWGVGYLVTALGAKRYGASRWGIAGAAIGMIGGLFLPIPILGPLIGAFAGALLLECAGAKRGQGEAARAGFGAALGAVLGLVAELAGALLMVGVVTSAFLFSWLF